ncbi:MAG: hypothetical protein DRJ50_05540 [Actinobacteria bacterium]|nr:MAG: hypothetical protein DRJ50_05540 [Actinomycetota bacterium]
MLLNDSGAPTIGFLHTSPVHIGTFDTLVAEHPGGFNTVEVVDEPLLDLARSVGPSHPDVVAGISSSLDELERAGASIVVCTCSTIAGEAELVGERFDVPVVRVDRAMAERAIASGTRIAVVGALESTFSPTRALLESCASSEGVSIEITDVFSEGSWDNFEAGNIDGYMQSVAATCSSLGGTCDVIVLAQASMAVAATMVEGPIPVLSSPALAVEAAIAAVQDRLDSGQGR